MTRVEIDGESYACPFAGVLRPHTPAERAAMRESILLDGVMNPVIYYISDLHGRAIIDGVNRPVYVAELVAEGHDVDPPRLLCLGRQPDATARRMALALNLARRHLSQEEQQAARGERVRRVAAAVASGAGIRETARAEGVSHVQVLRDIQLANGGTRVPRRRQPIPLRAFRAAKRLDKMSRDISRERLAPVAESHGVPVAGKTWPALEGVLLTLRDLAGGAASV